MRTMIAVGRSILALAVLAACVAPATAAAEGKTRGGEGHARGDKVKVATASTASVNINTADVKELMTLDGIGHKVAEKIVQYRDAHGEFKKADEIRKVDGVGHGLWEKNRERIVVK